MTILEPTTFPRAANAAVVLLDTAQTGILACGMMVLLIAACSTSRSAAILAFSGIMAGLAAKHLGPASRPGVPGRVRMGHAARRHQRRAGHQVQDQCADRHAGDAVDLSRRAAAGLRRRRHQHRQRLHDLRPDADPGHLLALLVHGRDRPAVRLPGRPHPLLPPGLLHRRQRQGGEAVGHQRRSDGVQLLRHHGAAGPASPARCWRHA